MEPTLVPPADPIGGGEFELASPSPSPTRALPTMPVLTTPALPTIAGLPAATPVKTDALGLPVLP